MIRARKTIPIVVVSEQVKLEERVEKAVMALDQPVVRHVEERKIYHAEPEKNRGLNIAKARTAGLATALRRHPKAEYFLFLDSDIVPPADWYDRIEEVANQNHVIGGWWRTRFGGFFVGGFWDEGVVRMFRTVQRRTRLTETHFLSLGCTLVPRRFLEREDGAPHEFGAGIDKFVRDRNGRLYHIADSGEFSLHVAAMGGRMFLDAEIVAEHLSENQPIEY
jgi:cellulose synthase/poly-beta-1,6-N-acetylglucosamine synthase-like glycosyltransferase